MGARIFLTMIRVPGLRRMTPRSIKTIIAAAVLIITAFFLFARLGYHALWDDEADTALFAKSIWQTGDTHAIAGHNLIAHTYGQELRNLYNRYIPPLGFYIAAPFVGLAPGSAFAARLPFAMCGLMTVAVMLLWLWRSKATVGLWLLMAAGILGNVSLMLFSRQCRYYSPAILATVVLAYLYFYRDNRRRTLWAIAVVSLLLLASNYMFYVAVYICLIVDYLIWGRNTRSFRPSGLAVIFVPQLILGGSLASCYHLLLERKDIGDPVNTIPVYDYINIFLWNLRELNSCELGVGVLILMAPLLYFYTKDKRLLRSSLAIFVYSLVIALLAPKPLRGYDTATVRYLCPLIPLCILTAALSIRALTVNSKWIAAPMAVLAFGTNILHGGPLVGVDRKTDFSGIIADGRFRSTVLEFIGELIAPPPSAYRATADWINQNLRDKDSVWVMPGYATYPLMYHAPKVVYAWQLKKTEAQFEGLPEIHFMEEVPPDYAIAFGPYAQEAKAMFQKLEERGVHYAQIDQINRYWYDLIRPELFWHSFREIRHYSPSSEAIYIFKQLPRPGDP